MIGETARNISEIKDSQERTATQRRTDDTNNKASLSRIEANVTELMGEKNIRKGGFTVLEKVIASVFSLALIIMGFVSMGATLGWWGHH